MVRAGSDRAGPTPCAMIGAGMGGAARPAAKLVIRSLKPRQGLSPEYEARAWEGLREAVGAVQRAAPTPLTQEDLFRSVETLCEYGGAPALFDKLYELLDAHAQGVVAGLAADLGPSPQAYLQTLGGAWRAYTAQLLAVRDIFMHLDRTHVHARTRHASLYDAGLELFRNWLGSQPSVPARAVDGLLALVRADRDGEPADRRLAATVVRALSALGIYAAVLEPPLLEATAAYYGAEGGRLSAELPVQAYLKHAERRLEEEAERCDAYLGNASRPLLVASLQATLLEAHMGAWVFGCAWVCVPTRMCTRARMHACTRRHARMHAATCTGRHARDGMHATTCTGRHARARARSRAMGKMRGLVTTRGPQHTRGPAPPQPPWQLRCWSVAWTACWRRCSRRT